MACLHSLWRVLWHTALPDASCATSISLWMQVCCLPCPTLHAATAQQLLAQGVWRPSSRGALLGMRCVPASSLAVQACRLPGPSQPAALVQLLALATCRTWHQLHLALACLAALEAASWQERVTVAAAPGLLAAAAAAATHGAPLETALCQNFFIQAG